MGCMESAWGYRRDLKEDVCESYPLYKGGLVEGEEEGVSYYSCFCCLVLGLYLVAFRAYLWLCAKELFLVGPKRPYEIKQSNLGGPCARQIITHCTITLVLGGRCF